jgi:hypothetical protein
VRKLIALLFVALVATLGACDPNAPSSPPPAPKEHKPAPTPAGTQAHQHPHAAGEADLHVEWTSENSHEPACQWSYNKPGVHQPCDGVPKAVQESGVQDYIGFWEYTIPDAAQGGTVELYAQGWPGTKSIECSVFWKTKYYPLPSNGTRCGGSLVLE